MTTSDLVCNGVELKDIDTAGWTAKFARGGIVPWANVCEDSIVDHDLCVRKHEIFGQTSREGHSVWICIYFK